ncbi:hypothetical protein NOVO_07465 [Rickettsiales bacterium Ac37b]|nr:hypothetical protein NOVO_07465 [Rickettsiales bacterium Ac37b]
MFYEKLKHGHINNDMKRMYDCKQIYLSDIEIFYALDNTEEQVEEYIAVSQKMITCLEHAINMVGERYFDNIDSEL